MTREPVEKLFTPQELAAYLDVPVSTLYDWRWRGEGPRGFRAGKHIRYLRSDVEQWIRQRLQESSASRR
jgi:excisionase family DNA binding protein